MTAIRSTHVSWSTTSLEKNARPHDIKVERQRNGAAAIEAVVRHIQVVGPLVRLEMERRDASGPIEAELSKETYRELALQVGESVSVRPRNLRVFVRAPRATMSPQDHG